MEINYTNKAKRQLKKIIKKDKIIVSEILMSIEKLSQGDSINLNIKKLKGKYEDLFRLRVRNYRVIYDKDFNIINVLEITNRKDSYNG